MVTISPSLVILGCSRRKKQTSRPIPAIARYDGPLFQVLRKHIRERREVPPATYILSGRFGLISAEFPTPRYNHRLTQTGLSVLRESVDSQVKEVVDMVQPESVFVSVGSQYWPLLEEPILREISSDRLNIASGSIGGRASQLAHWLRSRNSENKELPVPPRGGQSTLLGITVRLTSLEILHKAHEAALADPEGAMRFETWCVEIGKERIAPKWLVSKLFDLPVSHFRTADARRVLHELGVETIYAYKQKRAGLCCLLT